MENTKNNIRLGAFITVGLIFLLLGIYLIGKQQQLFNSKFTISSVFKDINGLQVGCNVRFAGINVGVVENITVLADTAVQIDFSIDQDYKKFIKRNAKAIIGTDGLMGNKIVTLLAGTAQEKEIQEYVKCHIAYFKYSIVDWPSGSPYLRERDNNQCIKNQYPNREHYVFDINI